MRKIALLLMSLVTTLSVSISASAQSEEDTKNWILSAVGKFDYFYKDAVTGRGFKNKPVIGRRVDWYANRIYFDGCYMYNIDYDMGYELHTKEKRQTLERYFIKVSKIPLASVVGVSPPGVYRHDDKASYLATRLRDVSVVTLVDAVKSDLYKVQYKVLNESAGTPRHFYDRWWKVFGICSENSNQGKALAEGNSLGEYCRFDQSHRAADTYKDISNVSYHTEKKSESQITLPYAVDEVNDLSPRLDLAFKHLAEEARINGCKVERGLF